MWPQLDTPEPPPPPLGLDIAAEYREVGQVSGLLSLGRLGRYGHSYRRFTLCFA